MQIRQGYFGDTRLDGLRFARIFWFPGAVHEGNGIRQLIIDAQATPAQREALVALDSGAQGGAYWEIFAAVCPTVLEPVIARFTSSWTASAAAPRCAFRRWGRSRPSRSRTR